jgi:hypothetical protein
LFKLSLGEASEEVEPLTLGGIAVAEKVSANSRSLSGRAFFTRAALGLLLPSTFKKCS